MQEHLNGDMIQVDLEGKEVKRLLKLSKVYRIMRYPLFASIQIGKNINGLYIYLGHFEV
jgi:hypothetical protein